MGKQRVALWASFATVGALVVAAVAAAPSASAVGLPVAQPTVVSTVPSTASPNITDGTVYAIAKVGSTVIVGGNFTTVQNRGSSTNIARPDILAFDASTGTVSTTFAPTLDGTVEALLPGPSANTVYVGGFFTNVNGVKSKGVTLLDTQTGAVVGGFKPPALNGAVFTLASAAGHLLAGGTFTTAAGNARGGLVSLNPSTGALDSYLQVQLAGHHNYNGVSGAKGGVGPRAMAVSPDGTHMIVVGNFKTADGVTRDQIAEIDLGSTSAVLDPNWATSKYSAPCASGAFDTYVTDVQYSPDGSYFAITATGGSTFSTNVDGSRSLCDTATRWESNATGTNVAPTWVDYTGNDTLWSVAVSGTAVYVGGHERWLNNYNGSDNAQQGAVPRPGMAALDPLSGVPLAWNPGRNPRGAGAYAMLVTDTGLYVGSDTDWIGNFKYKRQKVSFFPLAGGVAPASTSVAALPSNVYLAGPTTTQAGTTTNDLAYRAMSSTQVGPLTVVPNTNISWSATRGAFVVGSTLFYGTSSGTFYRASFSQSSIGASALVDPYHDPTWSGVNTGSGQTYQGVSPSYYGELPNVTGAFYANGRLYYTLQGQSQLYWRWFSPDSGIVGAQEFTIPGSAFASVSGIVSSGSTLYYASSSTGALHTMSFVNGIPDTTTDQTVSTLDWRARSLFLYGPPSFPNSPPTASATVTCTQLACSFDGTHSSDTDGTVASYQWSFGDGATGTGATTTHSYAGVGTYNVTLTVTDDRGATSSAWTGQAVTTAPTYQVSRVGTSSANALTALASVTVPAATQTGDKELLFVTAANAGETGTPSGTGWQQLAKQATAPLETTVWSRSAPAGDAGTTVSVPLTKSDRVDLQLAVYRDAAVAVNATSGDASSQTHNTPAVSVTSGGSWVVSYWSVRSSSATAWTPPAGLSVLATGAGSGGGHVDVLLGDSGAALASGPYGPLTADSGAVTTKSTAAAIVLSPAAPGS